MDRAGRFKAALTTLVLTVLLCVQAAKSDPLHQIEFIIDLSSSMSESLGGHSKIDLLRGLLKDGFFSAPPGSLVALRVFGHRASEYEHDKSCTDSELVLPFQPNGLSQISQVLSKLKPHGYSPLAYSIRKAAADFTDDAEVIRTLVIISDGQDTCGGDPLKTVKTLKEKGYDIRLHIIGLGVKDKTAEVFKRVAEAGRGSFHRVNGPAEFSVTMQLVFEEIAESRPAASYGDLGRSDDAGSSPQEAMPIQVRSYDNSFLGGEDRSDVYEFYGRVGQKYYVDLYLQSLQSGVSVKITDSDGEVLLDEKSSAGQKLKGSIFQIEKNGSYYIIVVPTKELPQKTAYSIELARQTDY
ncbi:MAG: VWA domain-containing protein [Candidatus Dadabacteria bacterium]|nr:MAG: VWA domain-containing protein [Candidatus Dadabacteria bacterium]